MIHANTIMQNDMKKNLQILDDIQQALQKLQQLWDDDNSRLITENRLLREYVNILQKRIEFLENYILTVNNIKR
ncbi:hypothetical protein MAY64_23445, partial [Escherichia coli]